MKKDGEKRKKINIFDRLLFNLYVGDWLAIVDEFNETLS